MKHADEVFALGRVDGGFSADGGIHLCQQCGGDLCERDAALEHTGGKAGQIADHPAAQRNDKPAALHPGFEQCGAKAFQSRKAFRAFTGRQHNGPAVNAGGGQCVLQGGQMADCNIFVADHRHGTACKRCQQVARFRQNTGTGMNGIAARAKADIDANAHAITPFSRSVAMMRSTAVACGPSPLSTVIFACA